MLGFHAYLTWYPFANLAIQYEKHSLFKEDPSAVKATMV